MEEGETEYIYWKFTFHIRENLKKKERRWPAHLMRQSGRFFSSFFLFLFVDDFLLFIYFSFVSTPPLTPPVAFFHVKITEFFYFWFLFFLVWFTGSFLLIVYVVNWDLQSRPAVLFLWKSVISALGACVFCFVLFFIFFLSFFLVSSSATADTAPGGRRHLCRCENLSFFFVKK